ncbi:MAG TPA: alkaline phosphatase family protein [Terriglobales bacterium]|nr:alkaline phosphatase family protein [Terriglobales bacterium]
MTSAPAGITCPGTCAANFGKGTAVTLTAQAASGSNFGGFKGACDGPTCQLVLASNASVSATFSAASPAKLTVTVSGSGTVTSTPAGISCPGTCTASFPGGSNVALTATPASGDSFSGFSGACSGQSCEVALAGGASAQVTATFAQSQTHDLRAINHIIVMLQENRSFDHYFGHLPDYWKAHNFPQASNGTTFDGESASASNTDDMGAPVSAFNLGTACTENPSPSWNESHVDRNRYNPTDANTALMDGFVHTGGKQAQGFGFYDVLGHRAMGYYTGDQLNYYYFMASSFATSDRWFSPIMTRTQPNRMYLYAATSAGHAYPLSQSKSPQLTNETIIQLLQDNGISWKIYVHPDKNGCATPSCLYAQSYLNQFTYGQYVINHMPNKFAPTAQLMTDIQNGTLPQVAFVEPASEVALDEHSSDDDVAGAPNVQSGSAYVASFINTLMASSSWKDSAFILTYDEAGGFYDHVPPQPATPPDSLEYPTDLQTSSTGADVCYGNTSDPICGFFYTGYRVPLIVISPFTKKNYVSHTVMDYTAILKLIETRFGLRSLTSRDGSEPDMTEFFDFANAPWATPPKPPAQARNLPCILEALSSITVSPNPVLAGGQATVMLNMTKDPIQNVTVNLTSNPPGAVPASVAFPTNAPACTPTTYCVIVNATVPNGTNSLTITGTIGGIPVSTTVPVQ